jgi:hypothetical protein
MRLEPTPTELLYLGQPEDAEDTHTKIARSLMRLAEEATDAEARSVLFFASGMIAACLPRNPPP